MAEPIGERKCPFYGFEIVLGLVVPPPVLYPSLREYGECAITSKPFIGGAPCVMQLQQQHPDWKQCPFRESAYQLSKLLRLAEIRCLTEEVRAAGLPPVEREVVEGEGKNQVRKTVPDPNAVYLIDWYFKIVGGDQGPVP